MSDFWWKRLSQNGQAYGRTLVCIIWWVVSVDERRNDLVQRGHLNGRSVATSARYLGEAGGAFVDDEILAAASGRNCSATLPDDVLCRWTEKGGDEEYDDDDDDGAEEKDEEDTATCSYGFQMRGFLRRTTWLSTTLVSRSEGSPFITWRNPIRIIIEHKIKLIP